MRAGRVVVAGAAAALFALTASLPAVAAPVPGDSDCLDCHADRTLSKTNTAGKQVSLFVDKARLEASVHKTNSCVSCHDDATSRHPDDNIVLQPVHCARCHLARTEIYGASVQHRRTQANCRVT